MNRLSYGTSVFQRKHDEALLLDVGIRRQLAHPDLACNSASHGSTQAADEAVVLGLAGQGFQIGKPDRVLFGAVCEGTADVNQRDGLEFCRVQAAIGISWTASVGFEV
jgi:hypothetical protein